MTATPSSDAAIRAFAAPYGEDDVAIARRIWPATEFGADGNRRVASRAAGGEIREKLSGISGIRHGLHVLQSPGLSRGAFERRRRSGVRKLVR